MRMLLAGNWKMHGLKSSLAEIRALGRALSDDPSGCQVVVCPPATLIAEAVKAADGSPVAIGGQDCHAQPAGAYTGDISAEMLRDAGGTAVIVGHSERRLYHGETNAMVAAKAKAAARAGLHTIICVGETEAERLAGKAEAIVTGQLRECVAPDLKPTEIAIAYEPVWAIGTGRTPSREEIAQMHASIRANLGASFKGGAVRVLYGGSVKPDNAAEILAIPNVDGALVGGASLKAGDFLAIIRAAPKR
jgi:triosephosphate isomerase (TIM)